jgi:hypothetical protein
LCQYIIYFMDYGLPKVEDVWCTRGCGIGEGRRVTQRRGAAYR